jgi:hypothetical protein
LIVAVCRALPGLPAPRCGQTLDQILGEGQVRKLPPRLGGSSHLLGTLQPGAYLAPLFDSLGKSLARLLPRLESEGLARTDVLQEASSLWLETLRQVQEADATATEAEVARESAQPPSGQAATTPQGMSTQPVASGGDHSHQPPSP